MMKRLGVISAILLAAVFLAASCTSTSSSSGKLDVVVSFYPLEFLAKDIGGSHVSVTTLADPGVEPHDQELTPRQVGSVADADLVVYLHEFSPAVDDAVAEHNPENAFDVATSAKLVAGEHGHHEEEHHDEEATDPHFWLDPTRMIEVADAIGSRLVEADPANASDYRARVDKLTGELQALDSEYESGLATCDRRSFVVSHDAFSYLASRYELEQISIAGLDPEVEPSAARLAEITDIASDQGVTVVFFETLVDPAVAETLASQIGARTDVLDPIESLAKDSDDDYLSVMRTNLGKLRDALGCA